MTAARAIARRILVVDDSWEMAETMRLVLEPLGHQIAVAKTGESGVALASEFHPDVVFCDIGLQPAMDGLAVARALRDQGATAYLIALTGYEGAEWQQRAREAGFDLFLTKPVDMAALGPLLARLP